MALDWVRALIWPVVLVGALWVFRSQLKTLLGSLRVKSVRAGGVEVQLEQALAAAKENLEESREEATKAEARPSANARSRRWSETRLFYRGGAAGGGGQG
jgi:hypothetical protein